MSVVAEMPPKNFELLPKGGGDGELLEVSMGPQHPSTHGVFRMDVEDRFAQSAHRGRANVRI